MKKTTYRASVKGSGRRPRGADRGTEGGREGRPAFLVARPPVRLPACLLAKQECPLPSYVILGCFDFTLSGAERNGGRGRVRPPRAPIDWSLGEPS